MSVFDNYKNLPGFMTEFKDGGLQARTETAAPATDSILILGTAVDGPTMEPVAVDPATVEAVFGPGVNAKGAPNGSTVIRAFEEAYQAGCRDIRIMRISGAPAKAQLSGETTEVTTEVPKSDDLGTAPGNAIITFDLNQYVIDTTSVSVDADGETLPASAYTVTQGVAGTTYAKVALKVNVTNPGAACVITYSYGSDPVVTVTENGKIAGQNITYYIAAGADATLPVLSATPKGTSFKLYADGVEVPTAGFTRTTTTVTLKAGGALLGAALEGVYVADVTADKTPIIKFSSIFSGAVYNQAKIGVKDVDGAKVVVLTKPESKRAQIGEKPLEFSSEDYSTFGQLVAAINASTDNSVVAAEVAKSSLNVATSTLQVMADAALSGGNDGLNLGKQETYEILGGVRDAEGVLTSPGVYQLLENYTVDFIVPTGVYSDDKLPGKYDNFAYQLAMACAAITFRNHTCHGVIAASTPDEAGLGAVQAHIDHLLDSPNDFYMRDRVGNILKGDDNRNIDLGRFISVLAAPDGIFDGSRLGRYAENSAAGYAGFVSQLPPQSAPTNKTLPFLRGLRYNYSNQQLDKLAGARYVTYKTKQNGTEVAVTDAPTAAQSTSDYRRLTTIRVTTEAVNAVHAVCDPYIGSPNEKPQQNAMSAAIAKVLDGLIDAGVIVAYEFNVVVTAQQRLMGEAQIELTLVPPQELRRITTIVSLRPSL